MYEVYSSLLTLRSINCNMFFMILQKLGKCVPHVLMETHKQYLDIFLSSIKEHGIFLKRWLLIMKTEFITVIGN